MGIGPALHLPATATLPPFLHHLQCSACCSTPTATHPPEDGTPTVSDTCLPTQVCNLSSQSPTPIPKSKPHGSATATVSSSCPSSDFSSASSDTTDSSMTSLSHSSNSLHPSPQLCECSGSASASGCGSSFGIHASTSTKTFSTGLAAGCSCISIARRMELELRLGLGPELEVEVNDGERRTGERFPFGVQSMMTTDACSFSLPAPAMESHHHHQQHQQDHHPEAQHNHVVMRVPFHGHGDLSPPENFGVVAPGVYRSSFPKEKHFGFLKSLGLKSVLTLVQDEYPAHHRHFLKHAGIEFFQFGIPGNKEPFVHIPEDKIRLALAHLLDRRNYPILIHCNKGKHRTGCLVGCLRKMQHWSSTSIFDEYRRYAYPKSRNMDQQFIELFDQSAVWGDLDSEHAPRWLDLTV